VVTGANTGIGRATVLALASRGASRIVVASRSREKTEPVLADLRERNPRAEIVFVPLELGDLSSCARAADQITVHDRPIDALVDNAGIAGVRGLTKDGFELTFGTNHLGPFVFTEKLLPLVERAPQGRIVIVSSIAHYGCRQIDWDALRKPTSWTAMSEYSVSKLCNVLYAKELARRLAITRVTTYSLHPGAVASDIWTRRLGMFAWLITPFMITNEDGARTQLRCATDPALAEQSGLYYDDEWPKEPNPLARDVALQDELVRRSRAWARAYV
jgi:NAD(P)-dependent dehydrogenase (short-subunit alcohol dehydrogenase family)